MSERREWWAAQCARMSSLSYAAGYRQKGDEHYLAMLNTVCDGQARVVWAAAEPEPLRGPEPETLSGDTVAALAFD